MINISLEMLVVACLSFSILFALSQILAVYVFATVEKASIRRVSEMESSYEDSIKQIGFLQRHLEDLRETPLSNDVLEYKNGNTRKFEYLNESELGEGGPLSQRSSDREKDVIKDTQSVPTDNESLATNLSAQSRSGLSEDNLISKIKFRSSDENDSLFSQLDILMNDNSIDHPREKTLVCLDTGDSPSLTDLLTQKVPINQVVSKDFFENVDVITNVGNLDQISRSSLVSFFDSYEKVIIATGHQKRDVFSKIMSR